MIRALAGMLAASTRLRADLATAETQAASLRAEAAAEVAAAEREDEATLAAEGAALARSEAVDGRRSADAERSVRQHQRRAKALIIAADRTEARRVALMRDLAAADEAVTNETLTIYRAARDEAVDGVRQAFAAAARPLAHVLAAEAGRRVVIGTGFSFNATAHLPAELWSGETVVRKFFDVVPARLVPEGFRAGIEAEAKRIAAATLAEIRKEASR